MTGREKYRISHTCTTLPLAPPHIAPPHIVRHCNYIYTATLQLPHLLSHCQQLIVCPFLEGDTQVGVVVEAFASLEWCWGLTVVRRHQCPSQNPLQSPPHIHLHCHHVRTQHEPKNAS